MHLDLSGLRRRQQIRTILSHVERCGPYCPSVLLGDFNAPLGEGSLQELIGPAGGAERLADSKALSREPAIGATITFNGWNPAPVSGDTIDHVLVGPHVRVRRWHALAEHFGGRVASDHFPVIADLLFARGGNASNPAFTACQGGD